MAEKIHLWIEEPVRRESTITAAVTLEGIGELTSYTSTPIVKPWGQLAGRLKIANAARVWYRFPEKYGHALTKGADPFVLATLFTAMRKHMDMHVHGEVSPSLLRNLEEFQSAWVSWRPEQYTKIEISADTEHEQEHAAQDRAVSAFSGGVDSAFTAFRHSKKRCGRSTRSLKAGIIVHGFDILLDRGHIFRMAAERSEKMLSSLGMEMVPVVTNIRDLRDPWWDSHGAALASCLTLFQGGFTEGLVPSSGPYKGFVLPWGTNPVTDWMLSSDSFRIVYDGASFFRTEKVREIAVWLEAVQDLRVCMVGQGKDKNCNLCDKCIMTILNFRVLGLPLPGCFEHDVSDLQIMRLAKPDATEFERIFVLAKKMSINASWVKALKFLLFRNSIQQKISMASQKLKVRLRRPSITKKISGIAPKRVNKTLSDAIQNGYLGKKL